MNRHFNFNCKKCKNCKLIDNRKWSMAFGIVGGFDCATKKITTFENAKSDVNEIYCKNYEENKNEQNN